MRSSLLGAALVVALAACRQPGTVVEVDASRADSAAVPIPGLQLVLLPYDRDSVALALAAKAPPRPDTVPLTRLFDSLRGAYRRTLTGTPAERTAARTVFSALQNRLGSRIDSLRGLQQQWHATAYGGYDTLTLGLTHRLSRDPFADTTDQQGRARVAPRMSGPWWVTVTTWDDADPYSEWYWNLPLAGDTLRLNFTNAKRRTRF